MPRRVIATAEVQVAADIQRAEAGLEDLTSAFRKVGRMAERAAERAEAAFFSASGNIRGSYHKILAESKLLLVSMEKTDDKAAEMAASFRQVLDQIQKLGTEDGYQEKAVLALRAYKEIYATSQLIEQGVHDVDRAMQLVADAAREARRQTQQIENAALDVERRIYQLGQAFRDVGQDIDVAMAGGLDELQDDIRETIRRLADMGDKGRDVARIIERSFDNILGEFQNDTNGATNALMRLQRAGDSALKELDDDARKAAAALNRVEQEAKQADRSLDRMGGSSRRVSGDVRGLIGLIGAGGLGYALTSVSRMGLEMTQQIEKSRAAFLGLTGSVEGANKLLDKMAIFARETPFNLANVTEAAAQLLAVGDGFGVTADNIEEYLTSFGNAISITGGGQEEFTRLVRVFGQMSSTGKVLGQDMNQLAQNLPGYDVWQALADGAGTSVQELRRLQNIGQLDELLTGNEAVKILVAGIDTIPGAVGAMERRMDTLGGALEKFKETTQLALSQGLMPFSDQLQDVLGDPVILNSVKDLSKAFGKLASTGLEEVAPEIDDLAAAVEGFIVAMEDWAPVFAVAIDSVGDLLNAISPFVSIAGKATDAVLGFGDGLGKMVVAAGLFAVGGPFGIGAGLLLAASGAMDMFGGSTEATANTARILAAIQGDLNAVMRDGEEVLYSEAQRKQIAAAKDLLDVYPALAQAMTDFGVSTTDLQSNLAALRDGTGATTAEFDAMIQQFTNTDPEGKGGVHEVIKQFGNYRDAFIMLAETGEEESENLSAALALAHIEDMATAEARKEVWRLQSEAMADFYEEQGKIQQKALDDAAGVIDGWGELDEERTEALAGLLKEQMDAYVEWEDSINESTQNAALDLNAVAEETENSVDDMIAALNKHSMQVAGWKGSIVTAASQLVGTFGVPEAEAQAFMATLGDLGPEFAGGISDMLIDAELGGDKLLRFFEANAVNADVMASDMNAAFDGATGSMPSLVESLADGTATVEDVLAELPAAMEAARVDFQKAAEKIDASDEMGVVGDEAVAGLVDALNNGYGKVQAAAARLAAAVRAGGRRELEISSPSRVMFEIGEFAVEGLVRGMQSMSDETYAAGAFAAKLLAGGIEHYFRDAEKPQEEARKFAEDVAKAIIDELIAEQEAVADAAEALANAAADRLSEAWERVKDRFKTRDLKEAITEAQAEMAEALAELRSAESLTGAGGAAALAAAQQRVAKAEALLTTAKAADEAADRAAADTLTAFRRQTQDTVDALKTTQAAELAAIQARIATATRNLDPVARAAAEADLAAAKERQAAETTALARRREDEEDVLRTRLTNENAIREAAVKAQQDELKAFEKGLADVVKSISDAISNLPGLRDSVTSAQRGTQDAFLDQFEQMLENVDAVDRTLLQSIGSQSGLTATEVTDLINSALASSAASRGAASAAGGVGDLLDILSSGLYTIGANGALGIAQGITSEARAIAVAMQSAVQIAVNAALAALEISSPSRVTARMIGKPMAEGIAAGLSATIPDVSYAMAGLLDSVVNGTKLPSTSQLDNGSSSSTLTAGAYSGPLVTMPGAIIQDATDADLVAQRVVAALAATGVS